MPKCAYPISEFDRRRREFENEGFDCVEWHLGYETEILDGGIIPVGNDEVIIARFVRRSEITD